MSRSGYSEDYDLDNWQAIRYRGAVASAFKGKRGQAFLKEMLQALDQLPEKRLVTGDLETGNGSVCAIGAVGKARGVDMKDLDPENIEGVAHIFGVAEAMAREVVYMNDDWFDRETPERRYIKMREWIESEIKQRS